MYIQIQHQPEWLSQKNVKIELGIGTMSYLFFFWCAECCYELKITRNWIKFNLRENFNFICVKIVITVNSLIVPQNFEFWATFEVFYCAAISLMSSQSMQSHVPSLFAHHIGTVYLFWWWLIISICLRCFCIRANWLVKKNNFWNRKLIEVLNVWRFN